MASEEFSHLSALYKDGQISFATRGLAHMTHDTLLRDIISRQQGRNYQLRQLVSAVRWMCEAAVLAWLAIFSAQPWWVSGLLLVGILWAEHKLSGRAVQAMVINTAMDDEHLFEHLWQAGLIGVYVAGAAEVYANTGDAPVNWRHMVEKWRR